MATLNHIGQAFEVMSELLNVFINIRYSYKVILKLQMHRYSQLY